MVQTVPIRPPNYFGLDLMTFSTQKYFDFEIKLMIGQCNLKFLRLTQTNLFSFDHRLKFGAIGQVVIRSNPR